MIETYRMLGAEREAELLHEARKLHALSSQKSSTRFRAVLSKSRRLAMSLTDRVRRGSTAPALVTAGPSEDDVPAAV